jgi:hypothetical protein
MLRKGSLIARASQPRGDGSYAAVTLHNRPPYGIMAWAGFLQCRAIDKPAEDITLADYNQVEKVSFCRWSDVWEYFAQREYAPLVQRLHDEVSALYPGEQGAPAQPPRPRSLEPMERTRL